MDPEALLLDTTGLLAGFGAFADDCAALVRVESEASERRSPVFPDVVYLIGAGGFPPVRYKLCLAAMDLFGAGEYPTLLVGC